MVFLAYSTTPAVARRFGAGDPSRAVSVGIDGMWLALGIGAILALAGYLATPFLVGLFGATPRGRRGRRDLPRHLDVGAARDAHRVRGDRAPARHAGHRDPAVDRRSRLRRERAAQLALHLRVRLGHRRVGVRHGGRPVGHGRRVRRRDRPARTPARRIRPPPARRCARIGALGRLAVPADAVAARRTAGDGGRRDRPRHRGARRLAGRVHDLLDRRVRAGRPGDRRAGADRQGTRRRRHPRSPAHPRAHRGLGCLVRRRSSAP